jgi:hypothetical protein
MAKKLAVTVFLLLLAAGAAQLVVYFPDLPRQVVTQTDAHGAPSTTILKVGVAAIFVIVLLFCTAWFLGLGHFLGKLPDRYFKVLPGRDYWLAPQRRAETIRSLQTHLVWLGNATLGMFLAIFQAIFVRNTGGPEFNLSTASSLFTALYLTYVFFALIKLQARFRRGEKKQDKGAA